MNEQEYRKQLLVQQIQYQREHTIREFTLLKESSPIAAVLSLLRTIDGAWHALSPGVTALTTGVSGRGKFFGLNFAIILPVLVQIVSSLLGRKKRSS